MAHLLAPGDQLEIDRAVAKFFEIRIWGRILQRGPVLTRRCDQRVAYFVHVAAVSHADWQAKADSRIAIMPICHRRVDEFRVRHDHSDIVAGHNDGAARANLLHLTRDARNFDAVADGDGSFGQNDQAANEIARDILQSKATPDADRPRKNGERAEMDAGVFQNNENADDKHDIANDLGNRVLKGAVQPAMHEETVEKKTFGSRGNPENDDEERDEQKNLDETERNTGQRRVPAQRNAGGINRADCKKDQR